MILGEKYLTGEESMPDDVRTANKQPPVPTKLCPTCEGDAVRYLSGPSWGYWGGQDIEYAECPTCDGIGTIPDNEEDV